jgi:hypothetical protein
MQIEYTPELLPPVQYDEDEILILGGKFADGFTKQFFEELRIDHEGSIRDVVADTVETVMRDYQGDADVPLPKDLLSQMQKSAEAIATEVMADILNNLDVGGEGF